jgi:hypothetical protein
MQALLAGTERQRDGETETNVLYIVLHMVNGHKNMPIEINYNCVSALGSLV